MGLRNPSLSDTQAIETFSAIRIWENLIHNTEIKSRNTTANITDNSIEVEKSKNSESTTIFDRHLYSEEFLDLI